MGWSFCYSHDTKAKVIADANRLAPGYTLIKSKTVGNHHWQVIGTPEGTPQIAVALLAYDGKDKCWGVKGLTESAGPCAIDCPLAFLDEAPMPTTGYAANWRDRVRAHHAANAERKANPLTVGDCIKYGKLTLRLEGERRTRGRRVGWNVTDTANGNLYKISSRKAAQAART